jgi:hypothetical protein
VPGLLEHSNRVQLPGCGGFATIAGASTVIWNALEWPVVAQVRLKMP